MTRDADQQSKADCLAGNRHVQTFFAKRRQNYKRNLLPIVTRGDRFTRHKVDCFTTDKHILTYADDLQQVNKTRFTVLKLFVS